MAESKSNRLVKNSLYLYARMILVLLVKLYTSRVVINALGFDDFGIYNVVGSVVIFCSFFRSALNNATYRYIAYGIGTGDYKETSKVYTMAIKSHLILAAILLVLLEAVGVWFINNHLVISEDRLFAANVLFQFSLLNFCVSIVQTPFQSNIIANERMNFYAMLSIVEVILQLLIAYIIIESPIDKLITYGALLFLVNLVIGLANLIYASISFKEIKYVRVFWDGAFIKKFASYSGWSVLVNMADMSSEQLISVFFNWFLGVIANAALAINNQVNSALHYFTDSLFTAFKPQIIKSYAEGNYSYFTKLIFSSSKIAGLFLLIVLIPLLLNIEYVLKTWLGEYPDMTPAFIKVTALYYIFDIVQMPLVYAVHATGNIKTHQIFISVIKFLSIPLTYLALYLNLGGVGALFAWSFMNVVCSIARTLYMKKLINLDITSYLRKVAFKLILFVVLVIPLPWFLSTIFSNFSSLIFTTLTSVFLSFVVGYFITLNNEERAIIKRMPVLNRILK